MAGNLGGLGGDIATIGGAVASLFTSQGNAAEAKSYTSAGQLEEQNALLTKTSTRIQELQTARTVAQTLGTQTADVAGAGFTESGSALDLLKSSAQQGSLAKSLVNIQGAINENAYAAEAGADYAKAKAANEANTAGTISAIAAIGGALISGGQELASAGNTVAKGYKSISSLFSSSGQQVYSSADAVGPFLPETAQQVYSSFDSVGPFLSNTDFGIQQGANLGAAITSTDIGIDTSGIALGTSTADATAGITDAIASGFSDALPFVGDAISLASTVGDFISGDVAKGAENLIFGSSVVDAVTGIFGSVICTAFYKRGMIAPYVWFGAQRYGKQLDSVTFAGYIRWALPIAEQISNHRWFARIAAPIFIPAVNEMARLMGREQIKQTVYGTISHRLLLGLSWAVGRIIKRKAHAARA